jgi:ATP-dependent HslUV protease ATP-binding subunit HslU|tara:strand:- start:681 stop:2102 length:1422 start_codon:yes stop_codon:yes gene_type:complete
VFLQITILQWKNYKMSGSKKVTNLNLVKDKNNTEQSKVSALSPREIVSELDRYVIGQKEAKKAVAVALRNRWRRQALSDEMRDEVLPKNILMIGPTGVGKTEISRRLSKLAEAPFIKVEATRFTEVGYVGRDVEQIIRDLVEIAIAMEREKKRKEVNAKAQLLAEEKVLDALVGNKASVATRESFRKRLRNGDLDNNQIEIEVMDTASSMPSFEIPGMPGANVGMVNIGDILGKSMGNKKGKKKKMTVKESHEILVAQESDKMIEEDKIVQEAKKSTEDNGIVFLDEIDKVSARGDRVGGDVSREGVQRDLLPLIEGTTVNTKHGPIKTDHILFIASGAFQLAKPSDLLPELQGRLPIRVELSALNEKDFIRILKEPDNSLIKQYKALLKTENVDLEFKDDGIEMLAKISTEVNSSIENIGARRLHTIIEKVLDDISFNATDKAGEKIIVDKDFVQKNLGSLVKDTDLSKFIL